MKIASIIVLAIAPFLFACLPQKPDISLSEVPAGPMLELAKQRRQAFAGLTGIASVRADRKGRKRAFDSVGIAVRAQTGFRMEAYGPLGQPLVTLVWDGHEARLRLPGEGPFIKPGQAGLEKLLGVGIDPKELSAALSGNIPELDQPADAKAFCSQAGGCMLEVRQGELLRRVKISAPAPEDGQGGRIIGSELYRSGKLIFAARFEQIEEVSRYFVPMKIVFDNPDKKVSLTIVYSEIEVNGLIPEGAFSLIGAGEEQ